MTCPFFYNVDPVFNIYAYVNCENRTIPQKNLLTLIFRPLWTYLPKFSTGLESLRSIDAMCHYSHVFIVQNGNVHVNPFWVPITYLCFSVKSFSSLPLIHSHKVLSICAECKKFYRFVNRFWKNGAQHILIAKLRAIWY